jgi:hypothetical protein
MQDNRVLFKCPNCNKRRNYTFLKVRRKTVKCYYCGEMIRCVFNRRPEQREMQSGLLTLKTIKGKELSVMMRDISSKGIGFEVKSGKDLRSIKVGQEISLTPNWYFTRIPKSRYKVQSIKGFRVGAMLKR